MSEPIKIGDLVVVVRPRACCPHPGAHLGHIFRVARFRDRSAIPCPGCKQFVRPINACAESDQYGYGVERLKRIPPLSELESERTEEDLREPELQGIDYADI